MVAHALQIFDDLICNPLFAHSFTWHDVRHQVFAPSASAHQDCCLLSSLLVSEEGVVKVDFSTASFLWLVSFSMCIVLAAPSHALWAPSAVRHVRDVVSSNLLLRWCMYLCLSNWFLGFDIFSILILLLGPLLVSLLNRFRLHRHKVPTFPVANSLWLTRVGSYGKLGSCTVHPRRAKPGAGVASLTQRFSS